MEIPISELVLTFDQNLVVMTASVLPAVVLCILQYVFLETLGERWQLVAISAAMILAFRAGIAPAFFSRVDHPLHWLDRVRWILSCASLAALLLTASCSHGPVYGYNCFRPQATMSLSDYSELHGGRLGLVTIEDAAMDAAQVGAAPHCSDCTAQQCVVKDCRSAAKLPKLPHFQSWEEVSGGGSCSITCLYVAPLYLSQNGSTSGAPVAWAVQNGRAPPRPEGTAITGTGHVGWWIGTRKDYQGAIDEVILQRFKGLTHCDGQQPLPVGLSDCRARGYDVCRTRQGLLGKCCCPIGYKVVGRKCLPCTGTVERVNAWHKLPLVYVLHPETGRFAFSLMCLWSLVLLPLPWAILAQKMWRHLLLREAQQDHVRHYLVHHQRPRMAETWWTRHRQHRQGPMAVWVSSMSGQTKELSGFFPTSLLAHLRHAAADAFAVPFGGCCLVMHHAALQPEMDFKNLSDLGIEHGSQLCLVHSKERWRRRNSSESDALSFFGRTEKVDCEHEAALLHMQEAQEGWQCNACERHFEVPTMLWRCEICNVDFCGECSAAAEFFNE